MLIDPDSSPPNRAPDLWLVCAWQGWALGWAEQATALTEASWPDTEPPTEFPARLFQSAIEQALQQAPMSSPLLVLWVATWPHEQAPHWWPEGLRRLKPWRHLAREMKLQWGRVQVIFHSHEAGSLWDGALRAHQENLQSGSNSTEPQVALAAPLRTLAVSSLLALGLHGLLVFGLRPMLAGEVIQAQIQADQVRVQEHQRQAQTREQSHATEQVKRTKEWHELQTKAKAPVEALVRVLHLTEARLQPQYWINLRFADGAWNLQGVTSHEAALEDLLQGPLSAWNPQVVQAGSVAWPPEPDWGWPAWQFQVRWALNDPTADRAPP